MRDQRIIKYALMTCAIFIAGGLILPILARPSNCGGNSAAMYACSTISTVARLHAKENHGFFAATSLDLPDRGEIARFANYHWTAGAKYFVRTNFTLNDSSNLMVAVCSQAYSNVPQPTLFNLYRHTPAHAVSYVDGSTKLITPEEFKQLDLSAFVDVSTLKTNASPQFPTKMEAPR